MAYDNTQKQQQQFKIDVDANEIVRIKDDEFEGTISATVTRGSKAMSGQQVQIFLAGQPLGNSLKTDENGKVVKDFSINTAAKTISVEAQTVGFATRTNKFIDLPRPEGKKKKDVTQKIPHSLCVNFTGPRGQQKLIISVAAEDTSMLIGFVGAIIDGDEKKTFETKPDGVAVYQTNFTEKSRSFKVMAGNKDGLIWRGRLLGPKKTEVIKNG